MIFIEIKTTPIRLIFRRAFRYAALNRGKQLYTSGLGLSIVVKEFAVMDEIIGKAQVAWFPRWLELPAPARTLSRPRSPNR
jgi:hypothetical protein